MKRVDRVDQHGFPIPPGFDDQPAAEPRRKSMGRKGRWVILALLAAVIASLLVESPLSTAGRQLAAGWFYSRAGEKLERDDLPGALAELDWAIWCLPDAPRPYLIRGQCRLAAKDFEGSLQDYTRAIELDQKSAQGYLGRSMVYQRMGDGRKAIDDLNQAIKRSDPHNPVPLNDRAYVRAVAGIELKEGLADIEKALELAGNNYSRASLFYDTRGWIRFRMGDLQAALKDLDQAIDLAATQRERELDYLAGHQRPRRMIAQVAREWDQNLAVMHHHRGEVYQKLGKARQASADLQRGDKLGYNPADGVF